MKLAVPGTVIVAPSVMLPFAVADKLPPFVKVKAEAGKTIPALLKLIVKLRKAVSELRFVGKVAAESILYRVKSWTLASVAPVAKAMALLISLA